MERRIVRGSTVVAAALVAVTLTACAKRPATTAAGAPAPTAGAASGAPEPGPAGARPAAPGSSATATPGTPPPGATAPPTTPARRTPAEFRPIEALRDVRFDFDRYDIRPGDARILDENAQWMKANPGSLVLIEGHADERGTNEYNLALGERRARSAMNYLVSQGVPVARLTIISYGEERPLCTEKTGECWSRNRRAHFLVKPR